MAGFLTAVLSTAMLQVASTSINPALLTPPHQVRAVRAPAGVVLDGDLGDAAWSVAEPFSQFTQRDPVEGAAPTQRTEVRVLYSDEALYVGVRLFDTAPDSIVARLARRDAQVTSDRFYLFLDPYHDRRSGFYFGVSAAGTQYDGTLKNDDWDDDTWDGIWDAKVRRDAEGWTLEMRIPYSQLRFRDGNEQVWGINFDREIARSNEKDFLVFSPKGGSGFVSRFADLSGLDHLRPPKRLELTPYVTSKAEFLQHAPGDPFNDGSRFRGSVGVDAKVGLGSNLTLDATVNPDFGQVEVDPAVVNLTDQETFYPEKRPFFVEGADIFEYGFGGANNFWGFNWPGPDFFYSRRIGRAPQGGLPDAQYVDVPQGTTILGAAKLSGKLGHDLSIGTLSALTDQEHARLQLPSGRARAEVEPRTSYNVLRARREFAEGRQSIGLIATGTFRDLSDPALRDQLSRDAVSLGVDGWTFLDSGKLWVLSGWAGGSRVSGTRTRIGALQQSAVHYFQRPDAGDVELDPDATSLAGYAARLSLNKQRGNWLLNAAVGAISPGFETNDLGFLSRSNVLNGHAVVSRRWTTPGRLFRDARINVSTFRAFNYAGVRTGDGYFLSGGVDFLNYHGLEGFLSYNPARFSDRRTRGGPVMATPAGWGAEVSYNTDDRKAVIGEVSASHDVAGQGDNNSWSGGIALTWKPAAAVSVKFGPEYERSRMGTQYVGTFADPLATGTFGNRYVFAYLDQTTVSADLRVNWTFSPTLSLELYAQPLLSSGAYRGFKEFTHARTYRFSRYGTGASTLVANRDPAGRVMDYSVDPDGAGAASAFSIANPDFSFASLRGNAVLRWEFRPGSTFYLVWTQDRSDQNADGDFEFGRSLRRLGRAKGNQVVAVKFSYWWHP
jgi:hypothetical protein